MPRKKLSEEEKAARKAYRESPEGIAEALEKAREKERKLLRKLALKEHPELEETVEVLVSIHKEVKKAERELDKGAGASLEEQRERVENKIRLIEERLQTARDELAGLSEAAVIADLKAKRDAALVELAKAAATVEFPADVDLADLAPGVAEAVEQGKEILVEADDTEDAE